MLDVTRQGGNTKLKHTMTRHKFLFAFACHAFLFLAASRSHAGTLYGIDADTGNLYRISTVDASLELVGNTGIPHTSATGFGALEFAPNGTLYGFTLAAGGVARR